MAEPMAELTSTPTPFTEDDYGCCALEPSHDGCCAWICPECDGTTRCWLCNGYAGGDDVSWCEGCDGTGGCFHCYEGTVTDG